MDLLTLWKGCLFVYDSICFVRGTGIECGHVIVVVRGRGAGCGDAFVVVILVLDVVESFMLCS